MHYVVLDDLNEWFTALFTVLDFCCSQTVLRLGVPTVELPISSFTTSPEMCSEEKSGVSRLVVKMNMGNYGFPMAIIAYVM